MGQVIEGQFVSSKSFQVEKQPAGCTY